MFTGNADVSWDTTKEGLPQGKVTLSGRNVKVTRVVNDAPLPVAFDTLNLAPTCTTIAPSWAGLSA